MKSLFYILIGMMVFLSSCTNLPTSTPELVPWDRKCRSCGHRLNDAKHHQPAIIGDSFQVQCIENLVKKERWVKIEEWVAE